MNINPSARALRYWESRQAMSANNLANLSTPGYKAERAFAQLLDDEMVAMGSAHDLAGGALEQTGRPLDVGLVGDGFLVVRTDQGDRWTRNGSFSMTADGMLTDAEGHPVLGLGGPVVLPPGEVEITREGHVRVDGTTIDELRLRRPTEGVELTREGATLWIPSGRGEPVPEGEIQVRQGHLEASNVDAVSAMVEMIEIQRAYTAVQRSLTTTDQINQTITTEIGRVG